MCNVDIPTSTLTAMPNTCPGLLILLFRALFPQRGYSWPRGAQQWYLQMLGCQLRFAHCPTSSNDHPFTKTMWQCTWWSELALCAQWAPQLRSLKWKPIICQTPMKNEFSFWGFLGYLNYSPKSDWIIENGGSEDGSRWMWTSTTSALPMSASNSSWTHFPHRPSPWIKKGPEISQPLDFEMLLF